MKVVWMLLLLLPQLAMARVYMCVDPATGKTSFTDVACPKVASQEEIRVDAANLSSGKRYGERAGTKAWLSDVDTRKTGVQYNAERRSLYGNRATASTK